MTGEADQISTKLERGSSKRFLFGASTLVFVRRLCFFLFMPRFLIIMVERLFDVFCLHFFFKVFLGSQAKGQGNRVGLRFSEGTFAQSFLAEE